MNLRELKGYLRKNNLEDRWWIQIEGKRLEYPVRIIDMIIRKGSLRNKNVAVRHQTEFPNPKDIEAWEPVEFSDGFVLRTQNECILSQSIPKSSSENELDSLNDFKVQLQGDPPEEIIDKIFDQLNQERKSLIKIEDKLERIRNQLVAKEQELIHREEYIEQCEGLLIDKASQQEERQAELDQVLEDLHIN